MGTGFAKKKKQARMLQDQFSKMQEQMKQTEVTGTAAGGLVTVTMNGEYEIRQLKIKPECVDPTDVEGLEDLVKAAFKNAFDQLKNTESMGGLGDLGGGMPDLSQFGFGH